MNSDSSSIDLVQTMEKKSHKKEKKHRKHHVKSVKSVEASDCNICCVPLVDTVDCCTPAARRLGALVNGWANVATVGLQDMSITFTSTTSFSWTTTSIATFKNRSGIAIGVPANNYNANTSIFGTNGVSLITFGSAQSSGTVAITAAAVTSVLVNALYSFLFVNSLRNQYYEKCGRFDQVMGWYVDVSNGTLELYQDLPEQGIAMTVNRQTLLLIAPENLTPQQSKQLCLLNELYAISIKAVNLVRQEPKTEGNILDVKLKCGRHVLLAINTANSDLSVGSNNTAYTVVATGLY